jgi:hypothetical protein
LRSGRKLREAEYTLEKRGDTAWRWIEERQESYYDPRYGPTSRRFRLFYLLLQRPCTREDIFAWMWDYYGLKVADGLSADLALQRAGRMFQRDLQYIEKMGYIVERDQRTENTFYQIVGVPLNL